MSLSILSILNGWAKSPDEMGDFETTDGTDKTDGHGFFNQCHGLSK